MLVGFVFSIFSKTNDVSEIIAELSSIEKEEKYYRSLKRVLTNTGEKRSILSSFFVNPADFVPFIEKIEALGTHAGVKVITESAEMVDNNRNLKLNLFVDGDFDETLYFLSLLELLPAKLIFERVWIAQKSIAERSKTPSSPWEGKFIVKFASI